MNQSSIYPRNETVKYCGFEFDYQADFTQFLDEARKSACQGTLNTAQLENKQPEGGKKNRKSWKNSLFSWLKTNKKVKPQMNGTVPSKPIRRGHVSGPVRGSGGGIITEGRSKRPASGPLTGLFGSATRRVEHYEVPYMCLNQINSPHNLQSYGPVYLVT